MLLSCPDRGERSRLRAQPVCWGRWQVPYLHDLAWRIFFAALHMSVEYMVEHTCDNSDRGHHLPSPAISRAYRAAVVYLMHQLPLAAAAPAFDLARHPALRALSTDSVTSWRETSPVSATVE
jgi:hypothetical protein